MKRLDCRSSEAGSIPVIPARWTEGPGYRICSSVARAPDVPSGGAGWIPAGPIIDPFHNMFTFWKRWALASPPVSNTAAFTGLGVRLSPLPLALAGEVSTAARNVANVEDGVRPPVPALGSAV